MIYVVGLCCVFFVVVYFVYVFEKMKIFVMFYGGMGKFDY